MEVTTPRGLCKGLRIRLLSRTLTERQEMERFQPEWLDRHPLPTPLPNPAEVSPFEGGIGVPPNQPASLNSEELVGAVDNGEDVDNVMVLPPPPYVPPPERPGWEGNWMPAPEKPPPQPLAPDPKRLDGMLAKVLARTPIGRTASYRAVRRWFQSGDDPPDD